MSIIKYKKSVVFFLFFFLLLITFGCSKNKNNRENCIQYIDSLRIGLGDSNLRVAVIHPEINKAVRPYAFIYNDHLIVLNKANEFYTFTLDCFDRDAVFEGQLNTI